MKEQISHALKEAVAPLGIDALSVRVGYPEDASHGDFATNVAMANAKALKMPPRALAEKIAAAFEKAKPDIVESVSVAGPGFINIALKGRAVAEAAARIGAGLDGEEGGLSTPLYPGKARFTDVKQVGEKDAGKAMKVMVEYTDPNPFKVFHIGHLMSNAIGESIARLIESGGARVIRANWQGDVGPHVAKAVWGALRAGPEQGSDIRSKAAFWGKAYAEGAAAYEESAAAKAEIDAINKKIYERSDPAVNALYDRGRAESLEAFEGIYARLGTKFDNYFFEGTEGRNGDAIVREHIQDGVFAESEGAVVFKGEDHGLHTRVFITSHGLPTYEAKELGLNAEKFRLYPDLGRSIIVTANEQSDYFKVLLKVMSLIYPKIAERTEHISHGLMRFASGKMSSRKGNVISGEALIDEIKAMVKEKMAGRDMTDADADAVSDQVAIAAIKYTILRQSVGSDVIFDSAKSISFEGDSGPYLQYSAVRARSVLEKAQEQGERRKKEGGRSKEKGERSKEEKGVKLPEKAGLLEKLLVRFPDIAARARQEYAPQIVATYITELAAAFNSFYAAEVIIDPADPLSPYRIALTRSFLSVMSDGLWLLGIEVPKRM
ncbi:MAG: arginine--tRNA ligase [Patescibacteria group bacterium]|nr:arginine--tRNA ligase [Patescibacteria group bacterium]